MSGGFWACQSGVGVGRGGDLEVGTVQLGRGQRLVPHGHRPVPRIHNVIVHDRQILIEPLCLRRSRDLACSQRRAVTTPMLLLAHAASEAGWRPERRTRLVFVLDHARLKDAPATPMAAQSMNQQPQSRSGKLIIASCPAEACATSLASHSRRDCGLITVRDSEARTHVITCPLRWRPASRHAAGERCGLCPQQLHGRLGAATEHARRALPGADVRLGWHVGVSDRFPAPLQRRQDALRPQAYCSDFRSR